MSVSFTIYHGLLHQAQLPEGKAKQPRPPVLKSRVTKLKLSCYLTSKKSGGDSQDPQTGPSISLLP